VLLWGGDKKRLLTQKNESDVETNNYKPKWIYTFSTFLDHIMPMNNYEFCKKTVQKSCTLLTE